MSPDAAPDAPRLPWRAMARWCALGVALRLALLALAGTPELHQDEANYVYLALGWSRFGFLGDGERYLWAPLWPWVLRVCLDLFGRDGLLAAKLFEGLASGLVGASAMGLAARLGGARAARWSGALWALYLPLAAYTHLLWSEPLFLACLAPALWLVVESERAAGRRADLALAGAGLCLGLATLVKELALPLVLLLGVGLALARVRRAPVEGLRRGALLVLAALAVVAPWAARNARVYGYAEPSGASLGANAFNGLNALDMNFDVLPVARARGEDARVAALRRPWLAPDPAAAWPTAAEQTNTVARQRVELARGLAWARAHPADFARTRVAHLADFVLPTSYFVRHQALARYPGPLGAAPLRRASVVWAVLAVVLLLALAVPGARLAWRAAPGAWVPLLVVAYVTASALLVGTSRFRVPLLPALFVLAGLFLAAPRAERRAAARHPLVLAGWAALAALWWIDLPLLGYVVEAAW